MLLAVVERPEQNHCLVVATTEEDIVASGFHDVSMANAGTVRRAARGCHPPGRLDRRLGTDLTRGSMSRQGRVCRLHRAWFQAAHVAAGRHAGGARPRGVGGEPLRAGGSSQPQLHRPSQDTRAGSGPASGGGGEGVAGRADWLGQCCGDAAMLRCLPPGSWRGRAGRPVWLNCRGTRRCGGGRLSEVGALGRHTEASRAEFAA